MELDRRDRAWWSDRLRSVRTRTEGLAAPLSPEDQQIQSMPLASPAKWHRAHTTWFFETFLLAHVDGRLHDPRYPFLFNSYYEGAGSRIARDKRGLVTRPTAHEVGDYRRAVDERLQRWLAEATDDAVRALLPVLELGLVHEEQHQELLLTDALHALAQNPLEPVYVTAPDAPGGAGTGRDAWTSFEGGVVEIGASGAGFSFDNERPRHRVFLEPYRLRTSLVTVGEVKAFIEAGGYDTPSLWLSAGFEVARREGWRAPLYADFVDGVYRTFSLHGAVTPADDEPACHLSFYEAEALARFLDARLPTEAEWEHAARAAAAAEGHQLDADGQGPRSRLLPVATASLFGGTWQWTRSSYEPYPGFVPEAGTIGEYNGKFMAQQIVLRGGSCFTPRGHMRASYRNFWPPETRFQMSGLRLARSV